MNIWVLGEIKSKWKNRTYRGGRKLRDEAPEGPAESGLAEFGHRTQGIGEGIKGLVGTGGKNWEQRGRVEAYIPDCLERRRKDGFFFFVIKGFNNVFH